MTNQFLMWFTRFGNPHLVTQPTLDDCLDLAMMLDDCETSVFDQYGVLKCVEHVGYAVIDDEVWHELLTKYIAEEKARRAEEREKSKIDPIVGAIYLVPPKAASKHPDHELYNAYTSAQRMKEDYDMLVDSLGADRVHLIERTPTSKGEK